MFTHRERILKVARGETVDKIPWVPRIDLWHNAKLKGVGFNTVDLGVNVRVEDFVQQVKEIKPDILGISALLTTTMPQMKRVIDAVTEAGLRKNLKIITGGAPVNQKFSNDIGADGYAQDAGEAISIVKRLMKS